MIEQAIDTMFAAAVPPVPETVNTVRTGDSLRLLGGIVTTILTTAEVIAPYRQGKAEPLFFA
jgi:hypothetical protein